MGFPAQLDPAERVHPSEDTVTHFVAREWQIVLQAIVVLSIAATAVTMVTFWFWAIIPASVLLLAYLALIFVNAWERRSRRSEPGASTAEVESAGPASGAAAVKPEEVSAWETRDFSMRFLRKESRIGLEILIGVAIAALALAVILLPWKLLLIGAVLFFFYMLFVMGPVWLGWFTEEVDHETEELKSQGE